MDTSPCVVNPDNAAPHPAQETRLVCSAVLGKYAFTLLKPNSLAGNSPNGKDKEALRAMA
jgi:hypothetical protein